MIAWRIRQCVTQSWETRAVEYGGGERTESYGTRSDEDEVVGHGEGESEGVQWTHTACWRPPRTPRHGSKQGQTTHPRGYGTRLREFLKMNGQVRRNGVQPALLRRNELSRILRNFSQPSSNI